MLLATPAPAASPAAAAPCRVQAPASIALPFGTFERVLADGCNKEVAAKVAAESVLAVSAEREPDCVSMGMGEARSL